MKSILLLTITLQVVLCRPDVSHLSGSLGPGKGYNYPSPESPFDGNGDGGARTGVPAEFPGEDFPVDEQYDGSQFDPSSVKNQLDPEGAGQGDLPTDLFSEVFPPLTGGPFVSSNLVSPNIPSSNNNNPNFQSVSIQSSISSFDPSGAGTGGVAATYVAGNPGVTHNAQLKGHGMSQKFINLFSRD